jgi:hypothetical protein
LIDIEIIADFEVYRQRIEQLSAKNRYQVSGIRKNINLLNADSQFEGG